MEDNEEISQANRIFRTLMHFPGSSFSDLWDKSVESNKFSYYLKKMEKDGLIEKRKTKYFLTLRGQGEISDINGETGKKMKRPFVALLLLAKKANKFVFFRCMKEPYYDTGGFPGAKVEFGEEILDAAERELKEETGLFGSGRIVTIQNVFTIKDNSVFAHMVQYVVLFENPKGDLIKDNREGIYSWATKEEILLKKNLFPDTPQVLADINAKKFFVKELKLFQKGKKFVKAEQKILFEQKLR